MSFLAEASLFIAAPPDACIDRLRDFSTWSVWMPASFQPDFGPSTPLVVGDEIGVRIGGVPGVSKLRISEFEPGRMLAWSGGVPGVLAAVHAFRFEARDGGTMARSEERWSGALGKLGPLARRVRVQAERVGADQLAGLAGAVQGRR